MSTGKATALALSLAGAFALGVWLGPYMTDREMSMARTDEPAAATEPAPARTAPARVAVAPRAAETHVAVVSASAPELQQRLRPVLNSGTNVKWAAEGFRSAEQFATVAHAARNTGAPFAVLKDRVLKGQSLASAIREFRPHLDAAAEVRRAQSMARDDVAAITG